MRYIKDLDVSLLERNEFENKRCYENAVWFVEQVNHMIGLYNSGDYLLFHKEVPFIPSFEFKFWVDNESAPEEDIDFVGKLKSISIGASSYLGHTRDQMGRIFVSKAELNRFFKNVYVVKKQHYRPWF